MRHIIVGTAGHIDHGKTTLVKALTGIDTDRLKEEKRRGISIELGFAHLDLTPDLRLGFVDVPGHEKFIRSMVAGVAGIDLLLFIVAANESIKPQTIEHFEICRLLGIRKGIIALTKSDLADPDIREVVQIEVEDLVAGSFLQGAPIVPVSATTGQGLEDLRLALRLAAAVVQEKNATLHPRLPIDRSFLIKGHGVVITGTLISGAINLHDELELYPTGKRVRVRGLQVHSTPVERSVAGERTAVNLSGAGVPEACRGMVLGPAATFEVTRQIDCLVDLLSSAPPLKHRAKVHFHSGTAEMEAQVRLISSIDQVSPGTRAHVRLLLAEPLLLLPGDRFIIRRFSPVVTIGGGVVIDIATPPRLRRAILAAHVEKMASAPANDLVAYLVEQSSYGMSVGALVARTGLVAQQIRSIGQTEPFVYFPDPHDWLLSRMWCEKKLMSIQRSLSEFHRNNPLQPGMTRDQLRKCEFAGAPQFLLQQLLTLTEAITSEREFVRLTSYQIAFTDDDCKALDHIEQQFLQAGLAVDPTNDMLAKSGIQPDRSRQLLELLLRSRKLVRVNTELVLHCTTLDQLRQMLATHSGQRFSVAEFKNWTGLSRKHAIPLLEFFDRERVLRREGDERVVSVSGPKLV